MIFFQFISAFIIDKTQAHATRVQLIPLILQLIIDPILFYFDFEPIPLVVIFVIRFALVVQVGNSTGKIFKMHLEYVLKMPQQEQVEAFNNVAITGDFVGRVSVVIGLVATMFCIKLAIFDFQVVKTLCFGLMAFWDFIEIFAAATLSRDYIVGGFDVLESSHLISTKSAGLQENDGPPPSGNFFVNTYRYVKNALVLFYKNNVLFGAYIHLWLTLTTLGFVSLSLRFVVSFSKVVDPKTRENFCGGGLTNLIEQQVFTEISRLIGAFVFQFIFSQVVPFHFYRRLYWFLGIPLLALMSMIWFQKHIGPTGGNLCLAGITILLFLLYNYDANVGSSVMDPGTTGFVYGLQGSVNQLLGILPILVNLLKLRNWIEVLIVVAVVIALSLYSFYFSHRHKKDLFGLNVVALEETSREQNKISFWQRYVLGRG
eukprot:TRINITY_DN4545_c0_g2_i1.p1 TRINITY_DN4545_c0_g2~~TRINITY_DN4545_c0_g2_i1.p1  ORF type:complete len:429 (+),score=51.90 TRINITY_DN4545_c0_g2_i1:238-1524(+)